MKNVHLRARTSRAARRNFTAILSITLTAAAFTPRATNAQVTRDSTGDSTRTHALESVTVRAIRAADAAPIAHKTINRQTIERRHFGQDVPLLLQGASPSLTAHTETGTNWGYSYLRLRGLDQTRINITIDGVPLNDMEDQVLYFANFADLMSNVRTVQVQRGVGTSSAGTASYAGSINFETMPIAQRESQGDLQLQAGSYGAQRVSGSFNTGLMPSGFAVYGRAGALRTNGYRDHSGVEGRSAFLGAGWFGQHLRACLPTRCRTLVQRSTNLRRIADSTHCIRTSGTSLDSRCSHCHGRAPFHSTRRSATPCTATLRRANTTGSTETIATNSVSRTHGTV